MQTRSQANPPFLYNTGVTAGTYGSTTQSVSITVNAEGQVTSISNAAISPDLTLTVTSGTQNTAGAVLAAGSLVYIAGYDNTNGCPMVALATNATPNTLAQYIADASIPAGLVAGSTSTVSKTGTLTAQNTNGATIGDPWYLGTAGVGTLTAPTTGTTTAQIVGRVITVNVATGTIAADLMDERVIAIGSGATQAASGLQLAMAPTMSGLWTFTRNSGAIAATGTGTQIALGDSGVAGAISLHGSSANAFLFTLIGGTNTTASRIYTFPDAGAAANVVLDQGAYTIAGTWIFSANTVAVSCTGTTPQLALGASAGGATFIGGLTFGDGSNAGRLMTLKGSSLGTGSVTYTFPDAGVSASVVLTQGSYSIGTAGVGTTWTFIANSPQVKLGSNTAAGGLNFGDGSTANVTTLTQATLAANRTYTMPDNGAAVAGANGTSNLNNIALTPAAVGPLAANVPDQLVNVGGAFATKYTLAANRVQVGTVLRLRAGGVMSARGASSTMTFAFRINSVVVGTATAAYATTAVNDGFYLMADVVFTAAGASGKYGAMTFYQAGTEGTLGTTDSSVWSTKNNVANGQVTLDTTAPNVIDVFTVYTAGGGTGTWRLDAFIVEIL